MIPNRRVYELKLYTQGDVPEKRCVKDFKSHRKKAKGSAIFAKIFFYILTTILVVDLNFNFEFVGSSKNEELIHKIIRIFLLNLMLFYTSLAAKSSFAHIGEPVTFFGDL